jgi:hypothetical protein
LESPLPLRAWIITPDLKLEPHSTAFQPTPHQTYRWIRIPPFGSGHCLLCNPNLAGQLLLSETSSLPGFAQ